MANRKNESMRDIDLFNFLQSLDYQNDWEVKKSKNIHIQKILDTSSKKNNGNRGEPDLLYVNEKKRLLILIENKDATSQHKSPKENNPELYAIDGIKHYLSKFQKESLNKFSKSVIKYLENWLIVGLAVSGNINDKYNHLISTFILQEDLIKDINSNDLLSENDYISFFENINIESITKNVSESSVKINNLLRSLDSQKRPILLSALMICLYSKDNQKNEFKESYSKWGIKNIIRNIPTTIEDVLFNEDIPRDKIKILKNELSFMETDPDINNTEILREILEELENNVIPLFSKKTNYDIIGKFYEEFLRYAGVTNVKKGIILTPHHITKLFTELIPIKTNDVILDPCCGTGGFLISGMNKLISEIENSEYRNKQELIKKIKQNKLIGFEKSTTMYSLSISNMLFRGDGKSKIFNIDFFSEEKVNKLLSELSEEGIKPTIGFMNPPYGGLDNKENPTKKEIQFLERLLDKVERYVIIIAPMSTFFKENKVRNRILSKHTLKYVINMPKELFQPNASTYTSIAVFETNLPHNGKEVVMYDLKEDGLVLSKNKGRTDVYNKWNEIKKELLNKINNPSSFVDDLTLLRKNIHNNEEWVIQAHSKKDESFLSEKDFLKTLKEYFIFAVKKELKILRENIDEITLMEILLENYREIILKNKSPSIINLKNKKWKEFKLDENLFDVSRGKRLIESDRITGDTLYFSASDSNNGLTDSISNPLFIENDSLIYTTFGQCYYVEGEFTCSDEVSIFKHKKLNKINSIFIATIINQNKYKYTFGRKAFKNKFTNDYISLPIDENEEIDWQFMEDYIKSLPYSKALEI